MPTSFWDNRSASYRGMAGDATCDASKLSPFGAEVDEEIKKHALETFPEECCGIVVDGKYIRSKNVHADPANYFEIDPELLQTFANQIQGMAHSHAKVMPWPSKIDMEQQDLWDIPWAIASVTYDGDNPPYVMDLFWFGDCLPRLPFLNRAFRPGIQDCFALARHFFMGEGHDIPDMPRDHEWWLEDKETGKKAENLFIDKLDGSGFRIIDFSDVQPGDGFACPYGTSIICHCGVLLPNEKVLHHLAGQHSTIETAHRWVKRTIEGGRFFRVKT